jgi:hypothetical protein
MLGNYWVLSTKSPKPHFTELFGHSIINLNKKFLYK